MAWDAKSKRWLTMGIVLFVWIAVIVHCLITKWTELAKYLTPFVLGDAVVWKVLESLRPSGYSIPGGEILISTLEEKEE